MHYIFKTSPWKAIIPPHNSYRIVSRIFALHCPMSCLCNSGDTLPLCCIGNKNSLSLSIPYLTPDQKAACSNPVGVKIFFPQSLWYNGQHSCLPSSWSGFDSRPTQYFSTSGRHQQEKNTILTFPKIYSIPGVQKGFPTPGIEPGPPGWEPGMLTTRPLEESTADVKPDLQLGVTFSLSLHITLATTMVT